MKVAQVAMFPRINNRIGVVKLYLLVDTTESITWGDGERHYLGWRSSQYEISNIGNRIITKDVCSVSVSHSMVLTFS
jgi:hypothetical protein